jgi:xanthine/uracil permease
MRSNRALVIGAIILTSGLFGGAIAVFLRHHEAFGSQVLTGVLVSILAAIILSGVGTLKPQPFKTAHKRWSFLGLFFCSHGAANRYPSRP